MKTVLWRSKSVLNITRKLIMGLVEWIFCWDCWDCWDCWMNLQLFWIYFLHEHGWNYEKQKNFKPASLLLELYRIIIVIEKFICLSLLLFNKIQQTFWFSRHKMAFSAFASVYRNNDCQNWTWSPCAYDMRHIFNCIR